MPKPHSQGGNRDREQRPNTLAGTASDGLAETVNSGDHDGVTMGRDFAERVVRAREWLRVARGEAQPRPQGGE